METKQCRDFSGNLTLQELTSTGCLFENGRECKEYMSTNGHNYCYYIIDAISNTHRLIPTEIAMMINFFNIYSIDEYFPIHKDGDTRNNSIDNISIEPYEERWKPLLYKGKLYENYEISDRGNVRRIDKPGRSFGWVEKTGYKAITLPGTIHATVHTLVAEAFINKPTEYETSHTYVVNHIDSDRLNNFYWNLEYVSQHQNSLHGAIYGNMSSVSVDEADMIRDMLLDPCNKGSAFTVYNKIHDAYPHITRHMVYSIKHGDAYQYTNKYDLSSITFPEYEQDVISTDTLDYIRDMLMANNFSPSKTFSCIDHGKYPNITIPIIKSVKCNKKEYHRSNKYDMNYLIELFNNNKEPGKGSVKKMEGVNNNSNGILDVCRMLLMTKTFHGSPIAVYNAIDHSKMPNMTINILKHIAYDLSTQSSYYRTDGLDLDRFCDIMKKKEYVEPSKELIDLLLNEYMSGSGYVTDEAYDLLLEDYIKANKSEAVRPYYRSTKTGSVNDFTQTLSKTYGVTSAMREGQPTYMDWFKKKKLTGDEKIVIQAKFDGCSVAYDVNEKRYFTRGDYDNGESVDVTELFEQYHDPEHDVVSDFDWTKYDGVKFEAILCKQMYNGTFDSIYKRPRDVVAATITSRNIDNALCISLIPLRVIDKDGVHRLADTYPEYSKTTTSGDFEGIQTFIDGILDDGATFTLDRVGITFDIDGVVVSVLNEDDDIIDEIAIKILNNIQETKIINIEYQYGKTGKITPVGILEPVKFDNVTVDHVGLSTLDRVVSLDLKYNDTVRIVYNIVPYLLSSYHDGTYPIPIPKKCPICGSELNFKTLKTVRCTNPHCSGLKIGYINRYCEKMKMMGISKGIITKLFDAGLLNNISDLYKLRIENIMCVEGFKEKSAKNIIDSIRSSSENVSIAKWLGALPIKDVSAKTWQLVIDAKFGKDEMLASNVIRCTIETGNPDTFMSECVPDYVYGFSVNTYAAIKEGIALYWDDIRETIKGVTFNCLTDIKNIPTKGRVTLTGFRDSELISLLTLRGYDVNDFSSKTMALVIPYSGYVSSKVSKANRMGIPIYLPEEAKEALK